VLTCGMCCAPALCFLYESRTGSVPTPVMDSYIGLMSNPLTKCPSSAGKFIRPERTYALMKRSFKSSSRRHLEGRSFQMACLMVNVVSIA